MNKCVYHDAVCIPVSEAVIVSNVTAVTARL